MWALVLVVQSMPYFAALITALISAMPTEGFMTRLNAKSGALPSAAE
jgi:hypothetical protein